MADTWQTIEQAAVSLRLSVRTVNRHIAAGKLPSRLSPEGRREVLVALPNAPAAEPTAVPPIDASVSAAANAVTEPWQPASDASHPPAHGSPFSQAPSPAVTVDPETVLALADNAAEKAEMAVTAYQTLARLADMQAREVRRNARLAWAAVAVMAAGVTVAVGWTSRHVTRAASEIDYLKHQVAAGTGEVRTLAARHDDVLQKHVEVESSLRGELTAAREQAARAAGELTALREQEEARQARETLATAAAYQQTAALSPLLTLTDAPTAADVFEVEPGQRRGDDARIEPTPRPDSAAIAPATPESPAPVTTAAPSAAPSDFADRDETPPPATTATPTSRPAPLRRKAKVATTRPAQPTNTTSSASTSDER